MELVNHYHATLSKGSLGFQAPNKVCVSSMRLLQGDAMISASLMLGTPKLSWSETVGFQSALLQENDRTHGPSWGQATRNSCIICWARNTDALKTHCLPCWPHGRGNGHSEKPDLSHSCQHFPSPCCSKFHWAPSAVWSPVKLLGQSELEGVLWKPVGVLVESLESLFGQ